MATAKKTAPAPAKKAAKAAVAVKASKPTPAAGGMKPIKAAMNKTTLTAHLAEHSGVDAKAVKAVMASLEATIAASLMKKGAGEFSLPGLFKVSVQQVAAKKARKGIDPFTKQERMFAAKPASVKVKVRALKKMKDAAM